MAHNPPRFFAPSYFAPGYWGGEQAEGSVTAALMGGSAMTAVLTGIEQGYTGGGYLWRRTYHPIILEKPKPAYISARVGGAANLTGQTKATASIRARVSGYARAGAALFATAEMACGVLGQARFTGEGVTFDAWARARAEDDFWLLAA